MNALVMSGLGAAQLAQAGEANLVTHASWVQQRVAGMVVLADERLTIVDSGLDCDSFNLVCRARLSPGEVQERVANALAYFRSVNRPFSWWVGQADLPAHLPDALIAAGLEEAESEVAMAADLDAMTHAAPAPPGLRIERVQTVEQMRQFAATIAASSDPPDPHVIRYYRAAETVVLADDSPLWFYVGYLDDQPVATAELTVGGGVVGLYGISTLAAHRRQGIGAALTLRPLLDAKAAHYRTAVLQAAAEGVGVYVRVGFTATGRFTEYKPTAWNRGP